MNMYVSNLSFNTGDTELHELFAKYGAVTSAKVISDRETGRSRGFGFVEMANSDEAEKAMAGLNNKEIEGRPMNISEAKPKTERSSSGRDYNANSRQGGYKKW